jgi:hypothetical protein
LPRNCAMRKIKPALALGVVAISLALTAVTLAADGQKFRADGTIQRISGDMILMRCSAQDIEIARDAKTKVTGGELRRGATATVMYTKIAGQNHATEIIMGGSKTIAPPRSL